MFVASAFAADAVANAPQISPMTSGMLPMLGIALIFYILLIRPNQKRIKDHEGMVKALRRGDKVVTAGGIVGVISKVEEENNVLIVEIAENVKVRVMRDTISNVVTKMPIANDNKSDGKGEKSEKSK